MSIYRIFLVEGAVCLMLEMVNVIRISSGLKGIAPALLNPEHIFSWVTAFIRKIAD